MNSEIAKPNFHAGRVIISAQAYKIDELFASVSEMRKALKSARAQIEYLHDKFAETGSGNTVLAQIDAAISRAEGKAS